MIIPSSLFHVTGIPFTFHFPNYVYRNSDPILLPELIFLLNINKLGQNHSILLNFNFVPFSVIGITV